MVVEKDLQKSDFPERWMELIRNQQHREHLRRDQNEKHVHPHVSSYHFAEQISSAESVPKEM